MSGKTGTARNLLLMFLSQFATWAISFVVNIYVPRYLGASDLGILSYVASTIGLFSVICSLGSGAVIVRSVARDRTTAPSYITSSYVLSLPLAITSGGLAYLLSVVRHDPSSTRYLIGLAVISLVVGVPQSVHGNVLQGLERFPKRTLAALVQSYLISLSTIGLVLLKAKLWMFILVGAVANVVAGLLSGFFLGDVFARIKPPKIAEVKELAVCGLPFLGFMILSTLYGTDALIIPFVAKMQAVGWYSMVIRLTSTTLIIPTSVSTVMLPVLSRQFMDDRKLYDSSIYRIFRIMILSGLPIAGSVCLLARHLIVLLHYGKTFEQAIPVLQMGSLQILLYFIAMPFANGLVAANKQTQLMWTAGIGTLVAIPACFFGAWLTQRTMGNAAFGAMASDSLTEMVMISGYLHFLPKGCLSTDYLRFSLKCIIAAMPLIAFLWLGSKLASADFICALAGSASFLSAAWLLGCIDKQDVQSFKNIVAVKMSK